MTQFITTFDNTLQSIETNKKDLQIDICGLMKHISINISENAQEKQISADEQVEKRNEF